MSGLLKKKYFLEIYIPIAIAAAPFIMLFGGLLNQNLSLLSCFCIGLSIAILVRFILTKRQSSAYEKQI